MKEPKSSAPISKAALPPVAILCGGQAARLGELSKRTPKSLISVLGRPFIDWQLELIRQQGAREVILCTGHLDQAIRDHVGNGRRYGLLISYSHEKTPLGTAGALRQALPLLPETFFVTYGDSYLEDSWAEAFSDFRRQHKTAHLCIYPNNSQWDRSNVKIEQNHLRYFSDPSPTDKCNFIDYGLGLMTRAVLETFPLHGDLKHEWQRLSIQNQVSFSVATSRFFEVGSRQGISDLSKHLSHK
jgi:NDP-sugar pyrophosphorylase family protein